MSCIEHTQKSKTYGKKKYKGSAINYHRAVYQEAHGELPRDMVVLHTCDNRRCINLEHLVAGTQSENVRDMLAKGRDNYVNPRGERHGQSKLTANQVAEIKESEETQRALALRYGVARTTISAIKTGRSWSPEELER